MITANILCHSDALVLFERLESDTIDFIYLDPPWFTIRGSHFIDIHEENKYYEFIYKILQQSYRVLKSIGSIAFYSEPLFNINIHPIIKKVFGIENFVNEFIIPARAALSSQFNQSHTTVIFYRKSPNSVYNIRFRMSDKELSKLFPFKDENGVFHTISLTIPSSGDRVKYHWNNIELPKGLSWRYSEQKLSELYKENLIHFSKEGVPSQKIYLDEERAKKDIPTIWNDINAKLKSKSNYQFSQSEDLLDRIVKIATNENDLVLDPFCGSGTTLLVCNINNRKWIGVDNSKKAIEKTKQNLELRDISNYNNINSNDLQNLPIKSKDYLFLSQTLEEKIFEMVKNGETEELEFKESALFNYHFNKSEKEKIDNILISISSFLNSSINGTLLIGVRDDKTFIDLTVGDYVTADKQSKSRDSYERYLINKISHYLGHSSILLCKISFHIINNCEICMIKTKPSLKPVFFKGEFYIRMGNGKKKLSTQEFFESKLYADR